ncbi:hypothetical protein GCM10011586_26460 [Silvibacterium dinghuense]|nr:hypothetical protein GCM10011586_26460 [Silvibacterium dinghuense]
MKAFDEPYPRGILILFTGHLVGCWINVEGDSGLAGCLEIDLIKAVGIGWAAGELRHEMRM